MPVRFLRPGITTSDRWNSAGYPAQSFYVRLITLVDDSGRAEADPRILKGNAFALREDQTPDTVKALCIELEQCGLALFYRLKSKPYVQLMGWHDRPLRGRPARPAPDENCEPLYAEREVWLANLRQWLANGTPTLASGFPPTPNALRLTPDAEDEEEGPEEGKEEKTRKKPKPQQLPDDQWLESLKTDSAYQGIDVAREYAKARVWCSTNNRQLTRRFFVNWLGRADKPLAGNVAGAVGAQPQQPHWARMRDLQLKRDVLTQQLEEVKRRGVEDAIGNLRLNDADRALYRELKEKLAAVNAEIAKL